MWGIVIVILCCFAVFVVFMLTVSGAKEKKEGTGGYTCTECGDHDCDCYQKNDIETGQE